MLTLIDQSTGITLGLAITVVGSIIGCIVHYAKVLGRLYAVETILGRVEKDLEGYAPRVKEIDDMQKILNEKIYAFALEQKLLRDGFSAMVDRMARVETKLDFIIKALESK